MSMQKNPMKQIPENSQEFFEFYRLMLEKIEVIEEHQKIANEKQMEVGVINGMSKVDLNSVQLTTLLEKRAVALEVRKSALEKAQLVIRELQDITETYDYYKKDSRLYDGLESAQRKLLDDISARAKQIYAEVPDPALVRIAKIEDELSRPSFAGIISRLGGVEPSQPKKVDVKESKQPPMPLEMQLWLGERSVYNSQRSKLIDQIKKVGQSSLEGTPEAVEGLKQAIKECQETRFSQLPKSEIDNLKDLRRSAEGLVENTQSKLAAITEEREEAGRDGEDFSLIMVK